MLIDVQQVIPLPEASAYIIEVREKEHKVRQERNERSNLRRKFWQGLLALAQTRTHLHRNISPTEYHWIGAGSGLGGASFNYVIRQHAGTIELFFGRKDSAENKRMFDQLESNKESIEQTFGEPLSWERLNTKLGSKIAHYVDIGGYQDSEERWPEIQQDG